MARSFSFSSKKKHCPLAIKTIIQHGRTTWLICFAAALHRYGGRKNAGQNQHSPTRRAPYFDQPRSSVQSCLIRPAPNELVKCQPHLLSSPACSREKGESQHGEITGWHLYFFSNNGRHLYCILNFSDLNNLN